MMMRNNSASSNNSFNNCICFLDVQISNQHEISPPFQEEWQTPAGG
jgi:hypothetical protein